MVLSFSLFAEWLKSFAMVDVDGACLKVTGDSDLKVAQGGDQRRGC